MTLPELDLFLGEVGPRQVARGGRPAACLPYDGIPAYESETGALLVMENLIVFRGGPDRSPPMLLPASYGMAALRSRGLTALHDDPDAIWSWRPILYFLKTTHTQRAGSQQELEYRNGLYEAQLSTADVQEAADAVVLEQCMELRRRYGRIPPYQRPPEGGFRLGKNARKRMYREYAARVEALNDEPRSLPFQEANERAERLLREHLLPQQRIDLEADGSFYVRGEINRLYCVELGNGFDIVDPVSHHVNISLCLHPEEWIPHADVALATKLAINSGRDGEEALLAAARPYPRRPRARTAEEKTAARLEERHELVT